MEIPSPTDDERASIDEWAKIEFGSELAGRYILVGGERTAVKQRGCWRSDPPPVDRLAPAMLARLGELRAEQLGQRVDGDAEPWLRGVISLSEFRLGLQPAPMMNKPGRLPTFPTIVEAAAQRGLDAAGLMRALFDADLPDPGVAGLRQYFPGLGDWICTHASLFEPYLSTSDRALSTLGSLEPVELVIFDETIARGLISGPRRSRHVWPIARRLGYGLLAAQLEALAQSEPRGNKRAAALDAMYRLTAGDPLAREELREWCAATMGDDDDPDVVAACASIAPEPVSFDYELPEIDFDAIPDPDVYDALREGFEALDPDERRDEVLGPNMVDDAWLLLQGQWVTSVPSGAALRHAIVEADRHVPFLDDLPAAVQIRVRVPWALGPQRRPIRSHFAAEPEISPLELSLIIEHHWPRQPALGRILGSEEWTDEELRPLVVHRLDDLIDSRIPSKPTRSKRRSANNRYHFRVFDVLPAMPAKVYRKLLALGIQGDETAWEALGSHEELVEDLIELVSSRSWRERLWAAKWLAHEGDGRAADPLLARYAREKKLEVRFAQIEALDALGIPPERYLSEAAIIDEASKVLSRGLPATLSWYDPKAMPQLSWADGTDVDPRLASYLVVQSAGLKRTAPTALARSLFKQMDRASVATWCDRVFDDWLSADIATISSEEALRRATHRANLHLRWIDNGVRPATDARGDLHTEESLIAHYVTIFAKDLDGSAAKSRGVLALVAAGGTEHVVEPSVAYLRKHYGKRVHQARALLEMLAHVDTPSATLALLSVAHRFRTKGLQELANELCEDVAERRGWTVDDLRWRSTPDAGFDPRGHLELDFGDQRFVATVTDDLTVALTRRDGPMLKSLPAPRATDDPDMATEAKKDFNAAKKALRTVAKELPSRLHEAMCIRRRWTPEEFSTSVLDHPIMSLAATRAVWQQGDDRGDTRHFRPVAGGNLIDLDGNKCGIDDRPIVLAHGSLMHADARAAWSEHLADRGVRPWFDQFSHTTHRPLAEGQIRFDHFQGAIFDSDKAFVGGLTRLGWQRGEDSDGAFLRDMVKRFPAANVVAHLNCGGLAVSFVGGEIVVLNLLFRPLEWGAPLPLADVPRVLLIETLAEIESFVTKADHNEPAWHGQDRFRRRHYREDVRPDLVVEPTRRNPPRRHPSSAKPK